VSNSAGVLYIVATPIGNLGDMTQRAVEVLNSVDLIAVEDTRNSQKLLSHFSIHTPMMAYHEHNERELSSEIIQRLSQGNNIALISDAGTPLISDPGYFLVREIHQQGLKVVPIPGASAITAALSVCGLATDRFCFEGFLPAKSAGREQALLTLKEEARTLIFYESPHRLHACLLSMRDIFGAEREATLLREISKLFETIKWAKLSVLAEWVSTEPHQQKGECVIVVAGHEAVRSHDHAQIRIDDLLVSLMSKLSVKDTAQLAAQLTGLKKNELYQRALQIQQQDLS
jgi:16S rRNA (cytidine1402-2'-O)-methyltransferase